MAIPNVKPGGGSFPVFNGASQPNWKLVKRGKDSYMVLVQFDFSTTNGMQVLTDEFGNTFLAFVLDFRTLGGQIILPPFKSVYVAMDLCPACNSLGPFTPLQVADSSSGQLLYVGCSDSSSGPTVLTSGKAVVCAPWIQTPGSQVMFSKRCDAGPANNFGAGIAIFSTEVLPPFRSVCQG